MGQAKRRQQLQRLNEIGFHEDWSQYGYSHGHHDEALEILDELKKLGRQVVLLGTKDAMPLTKKAKLPWLHEMPCASLNCTKDSFAWNPVVSCGWIPYYQNFSSDLVVLIGPEPSLIRYLNKWYNNAHAEGEWIDSE